MSDNYRTFTLDLDLDDIISAEGMDAFNDIVEEALVFSGDIKDTDILSDIAYTVVGKGDGDTVRVSVTAEVVSIDEQDDDGENS